MDTTNPCCCCLSRPPEKKLKTPYECFGVTEIYSDMIEHCFALQLIQGNDNEYGICSMCIARLRDSYTFKQLVLRSQAELRARLERVITFEVEDPLVKPELTEEIGANVECKSTEEEPYLSTALLVEDSAKTDIDMIPEEPPLKSELLDDGVNDDNDNAIFAEEVLTEDILDGAIKNETADDFYVPLSEEEATPSDPVQAVNLAREQLAMSCSVRLERLRDAAAPHACPTCHDTFDHRAILAMHMRAHLKHKMMIKTVNKQYKKNSKARKTFTRYSCNICGKSYASKSDVNFHFRTNEPYWCEICSNTFCNKKQHKLMHAAGFFHTRPRFIRPNLSAIADELIVKSNLKVSCEPNQLKQFCCEYCDEKFPVKWKLTLHKREHEDLLYVCDVCNRSFTEPHEYNEHKKEHAKDNASLHTCDICDVNFDSMYELFLHIRSHTGLKPFYCDVCGMRFSYNIHLIQHRKTNSKCIQM